MRNDWSKYILSDVVLFNHNEPLFLVATDDGIISGKVLSSSKHKYKTFYTSTFKDLFCYIISLVSSLSPSTGGEKQADEEPDNKRKISKGKWDKWASLLPLLGDPVGTQWPGKTAALESNRVLSPLNEAQNNSAVKLLTLWHREATLQQQHLPLFVFPLFHRDTQGEVRGEWGTAGFTQTHFTLRLENPYVRICAKQQSAENFLCMSGKR